MDIGKNFIDGLAGMDDMNKDTTGGEGAEAVGMNGMNNMKLKGVGK